ncbi:MAG: hypothetical protein C5B52_00245 [Bacteroidetes bacterium]|nr:MAG: hypothetical protein C5B52_00245 [Bacteroidota bacterium]
MRNDQNNFMKHLNKTYLFAFFFLILTLLFMSCKSSKHNEDGVKEMMSHYDHLILKVDADSIALMYTPNGELGDMAVGRDSIRHFLAGFKNVKVIAQNSTTTSLVINKDTAIQKGIYTQGDIINEKDTVHVKGEYIARWEWINGEGWRIKRMETKPIQ